MKIRSVESIQARTWQVECHQWELEGLQAVHDSTRNAQYSTAVEDYIFSQLQEWHSDGCCIFMQNGAHWLGSSPDFNPIDCVRGKCFEGKVLYMKMESETTNEC